MIAGGHGGENPNKNWFDSRGIWLTYILGIIIGHLIILSVPFVTIDLAWTLTNILHSLVHLYFLHLIKGAPWHSTDLITPAYDRLTYWEQINDGEQGTATRKFLTAVPIVLFLLTCMYTKQAVSHFVPNFLALVVITLPKLPQFHLVRLFGINKY